MSLDIALARSRSERADERYAAVHSLASYPELAAARRLVELLSDTGVGESHYSPFADDHVDTTVGEAAYAVLPRLLPMAWPALVVEIRDNGASAKQAFELVRRMSPRDRIAMPAHAHDTLAAFAGDRATQFERALAARHRDGELASWEAVWQVWIRDHPTHRQNGIAMLLEDAPDQASVAVQMIELLDDPQMAHAASRALYELPVVPDATWVRALAESDWPRKHLALLPALARYGEVASAILPICVELLDVGVSHPLASGRWKLAGEALRAFGPIAERVRPQLIQRYLAIDESPSLAEPSLRFQLVELLGRERLAEELRDVVDALPEDDWYAKQRKREIRKYLEG